MLPRRQLILVLVSVGLAVRTLTACGAPHERVDVDEMLETVDDLTQIRPQRGWRSAGSPGEAEALDYIERRLSELDLDAMEVERDDLTIPLAWVDHGATLSLGLPGGEVVELPVSQVHGSRFMERGERLSHFDSDDTIDERARSSPRRIDAEGVIRIDTVDRLESLEAGEAEGRILVVDFSLVDPCEVGAEAEWGRERRKARKRRYRGLSLSEPEAVVYVTQPDVDDGRFVARFWYATPAPAVSVDRGALIEAGVDPSGLAAMRDARLTLDLDGVRNAPSGNIVATIHGRDRSRAVVLGAHIDSPNTPGAFDDGSGSAVLLEVAARLEAQGEPPPVDVVLAWFGSEEVGLYGSTWFAAHRPELARRTIAAIAVDGLVWPKDGIRRVLQLNAESLQRSDGVGRTLAVLAQDHGVELEYGRTPLPTADNEAFAFYGTPNFLLGWGDAAEMYRDDTRHNPLHCWGRIHSPYETRERLERTVSEPFADMARVALLAALELPDRIPAAPQAAEPVARAVVVATHGHYGALANESFRALPDEMQHANFDVDLVSPGVPVTDADVTDADVVITMPPTRDAGLGRFYEGRDTGSGWSPWSERELDVLQRYVDAGGLLVILNDRAWRAFWVIGENHDWDANAPLLARFGMSIRWESTAKAALRHQVARRLARLLGDDDGARRRARHPIVSRMRTPSRLFSPLVIDGAGDALLDGRAEGHTMVRLAGVGENGGAVLALSTPELLGGELGDRDRIAARLVPWIVGR